MGLGDPIAGLDGLRRGRIALHRFASACGSPRRMPTWLCSRSASPARRDSASSRSTPRQPALAFQVQRVPIQHRRPARTANRATRCSAARAKIHTSCRPSSSWASGSLPCSMQCQARQKPRLIGRRMLGIVLAAAAQHGQRFVGLSQRQQRIAQAHEGFGLALLRLLSQAARDRPSRPARSRGPRRKSSAARARSSR